jgi:hypothetical protein
MCLGCRFDGVQVWASERLTKCWMGQVSHFVSASRVKPIVISEVSIVRIKNAPHSQATAQTHAPFSTPERLTQRSLPAHYHSRRLHAA